MTGDEYEWAARAMERADMSWGRRRRTGFICADVKK
jgi:hypothetical protein